jgi:hypothetical protein
MGVSLLLLGADMTRQVIVQPCNIFPREGKKNLKYLEKVGV